MGAVSLHKIDFKKFLQAIDLCKGDVVPRNIGRG